MALLLGLVLVCAAAQQPEQVHVAYGELQHSLKVEWVTFLPTISSEVTLCLGLTCSEYSGAASQWLYAESEVDTSIPRYLHSVPLPALQPRALYTYRVGSSLSSHWSANFTLLGPANDLPGQLPSVNQTSFLVIGDFGTCSDAPKATLAALSAEVRSWKHDSLFHAGDIAYNLETYNGLRGDQFMRDIEPIASAIPYMVAVGNHEKNQNFTGYKRRFSMPQGHDSMFYSVNLGPVHIIVYSSEIFCGKKCDEVRRRQWDWLLDDLKTAESERMIRPWLVAIAHKPLYCSTDWAVTESIEDCWVVPTEMQHEYEALFGTYKLDVHFHGHVHSYERTLPLYKGNIMPARYTSPNVIFDAEAPIYVIEGNAGTCREDDLNLPSPTPEAWSVYRSARLGYLRIAANYSSMRLERIVSASRLAEDVLYLLKSSK